MRGTPVDALKPCGPFESIVAQSVKSNLPYQKLRPTPTRCHAFTTLGSAINALVACKAAMRGPP